MAAAFFEDFQPRSTTTEGAPSLNLLALVDDGYLPALARSRQPANDELMDILELEVNSPKGGTPDWIAREMRNPDPGYQCASTASNIYREALVASDAIDSFDSPEFREVMQVLVPNWVDAMVDAGLAEEIPESEIRPGDVVVGMGGMEGQQNNSRHIGFVGNFDPVEQDFDAYSNEMGTLTLQDLEDRFGPYREEHYYRIYLPE